MKLASNLSIYVNLIRFRHLFHLNCRALPLLNKIVLANCLVFKQILIYNRRTVTIIKFLGQFPSNITSKINVTPKDVYLPISKLHSFLAVTNSFALNNISQICYCGQILLQSAAVNCVFFFENLKHLGVTFISLAMVQPDNFYIIFTLLYNLFTSISKC